jgi:hypothetical protein
LIERENIMNTLEAIHNVLTAVPYLDIMILSSLIVVGIAAVVIDGGWRELFRNW